MSRPSKKDIKAALDKLRDAAPAQNQTPASDNSKLTPKQSSQRIRKQNPG
ncbi:MAG: hypothetical protein WCK51_00435 [Armatimonadota bacterium]